VRPNGSLVTRHRLTNRVVPHVLAKVAGALQEQRLPIASLASAAQAASQGVGLLNLGVGLLNLGVGVYTAYKVHRLDQKLDQVDRKVDGLAELLALSTGQLEGLIQGNALLLGLLAEQQAELHKEVSQLRLEMKAGFRSVHGALQSAEARREAQELAQRMRALLHYYQICAARLRVGQAPSREDLRAIIDRAIDLSAWLDTRLAALPLGCPERLPLFIAVAFALHLQGEARELLGDMHPDSKDGPEALRGRVRQELHEITERASLYELAQGRRELIAQYVFLDRALRGSTTLVLQGDGTATPCFPRAQLCWDDGLAAVREALAQQDAPAPPRLVLRTLAEHSTWERLAELPRGGAAASVASAEVARRLGLPESAAVSEASLRRLLNLGPDASQRARERIRKEVA
jgi:hypothetical protein